MKKVISISTLFLIIISFVSCLHNDKKVFVETKVNKDSLIKAGFPIRIVNQYEIVRTTNRFSGKSFFIVDTKENLVFFFDKNGKFIAKSPTIDGSDKQSDNPEKIQNALKSWNNHAKDINFQWNILKGTYVDLSDKNRTYTSQQVYKHLSKNKLRFFPKGIYKITRKYHSNDFVGNGQNTYVVNDLNGKELALAIHGLYKSEYRIKNMNLLISIIGSDFSQAKVSKNFKQLVSKNNTMFNNSFGCINVPQKFLELTSSRANNSLVFVLGESDKDSVVY